MGSVEAAFNETIESRDKNTTKAKVMKAFGKDQMQFNFPPNVKLHGESSKLLFWTDLTRGENIAIEKSTALDSNGTYGYFLTRDK
ncbi:hypothetical protein V5799_014347, partial [Amblyomma americanum]